MQTTSNKRDIHALATNTPNLKDWGNKGLKPSGNPKQGYYILDDHRVIKLSDLYPAQHKAPKASNIDFEASAVQYPELANCKGIGIDKTTGNVKPGFHQLESGKVISINKLKKLIKETQDLVKEAKKMDVKTSE